MSVGEGPLPPWVQKKAADHIRERTEAALKLRERDLQPPPGGPGAIGGHPVGPPAGTALLADLPPFAEKRAPVPESLPGPAADRPEETPPKPMPPETGQRQSGAHRASTGGGSGYREGATTPSDGYFRQSGTANIPTRPPVCSFRSGDTAAIARIARERADRDPATAGSTRDDAGEFGHSGSIRWSWVSRHLRAPTARDR